MHYLDELEDKVLEWGAARGLFDPERDVDRAAMKAQILKTMAFS